MASKQNTRRNIIRQVVNERGAASVGALAEITGVSTQTIRRDLDTLCDSDDLRRVHGRIELSKDLLNMPFDQRADTNLEGKRSVASAAALIVPNGSTVFLSIGSTPLEVANALLCRQDLTVITNNLGAAMALAREISNRILLPGGEIRLPDRDIVGEDAVDYFSRFRAEFAIFGVAGIADDGGLLDFHPTEVRARQQMQKNAKRSVLVVDRSKFGRIAPVVGGNIADIDIIICDRPPGDEFSGMIGELKGKVRFAEGAS